MQNDKFDSQKRGNIPDISLNRYAEDFQNVAMEIQNTRNPNDLAILVSDIVFLAGNLHKLMKAWKEKLDRPTSIT